MRKTKFGAMIKLDLGGSLSRKVELMRFDRRGTAHRHDQIEAALCTSGSGTVVMESDSKVPTRHQVSEGEQVKIPTGYSHWMEPDEIEEGDEPFRMVILYRENIDT